jgi:murein DD-endopeptidase MepM/ murein hydrolase activator NlpD
LTTDTRSPTDTAAPAPPDPASARRRFSLPTAPLTPADRGSLGAPVADAAPTGSASRRPRAILALGLAAILVLGLALALQVAHAADLQRQVAGLQDAAQQARTRAGALDATLAAQRTQIAALAQATQTPGPAIQAVQRDLQDLRDHMARLDQHNAQLREALGLAGVEGPAPEQTSTPGAAATPQTGGMAPGGVGGESGPLFAMGPGAPAPATPAAISDAVDGFREQVAEIGHSLDVYSQIEENLGAVALERTQEWAQQGDEDDSATAPLEPPAEPPAPPPAAKPGAPAAKPVSHVPKGLPYYGDITSLFGWRKSPFVKGAVGFHKGLDIRASMGTPVHATQAGRIAQAGWSDVYGRMVLINHGAGYSTLYGHNSRLLVSVGDWVEQGEVIAYSGSTGMSTGPHIHYEVRRDGVPVNPLNYR